MKKPRTNGEGGFTMIELLVSTAVLLVVSGIVVGSTMDMTRLGQKMTNRSDMHSGVRNATALLQQEVGQAGRVSLPAPVTLTGATGIGVFTVAVSRTAGMFIGEHLIVGTGANEETVTLTQRRHRRDHHHRRTSRSPTWPEHPSAATGGFLCRRHSDDDGQRIDRQRAEDCRRRQWRWQHGLRRVQVRPGERTFVSKRHGVYRRGQAGGDR